MVLHYDVNLSKKIPCQTNDDGFAIHPRFSHVEDAVLKYVKNQTGYDNEYVWSGSRNMVKEAQEHAKAFNTPLTHDNALVLIHPFYVALSHMHELSRGVVKQEVEEYTKTVAGLLNKNILERPVDFVVMDTIEHYCSLTSSLLEYGYIDTVIFTQHNKGVPLHIEDLQKINATSIFAAGGYKNRCFDTALSYIRTYAAPKELFGVQPLILSSPQENFTTLHVDETNELTPNQMLSLDAFLEKTGLQKPE